VQEKKLEYQADYPIGWALDKAIKYPTIYYLVAIVK
jgi:hypothetical protein